MELRERYQFTLEEYDRANKNYQYYKDIDIVPYMMEEIMRHRDSLAKELVILKKQLNGEC